MSFSRTPQSRYGLADFANILVLDGPVGSQEEALRVLERVSPPRILPTRHDDTRRNLQLLEVRARLEISQDNERSALATVELDLCE